MTDSHDPMCRAQDEWEVFDDTDGHKSIRKKCQCSLIRAVRAEAESRYEAWCNEVSYDAGYAAAVDEAIRRVEDTTIDINRHPLMSLVVDWVDGWEQGQSDALAALAEMKEA